MTEITEWHDPPSCATHVKDAEKIPGVNAAVVSRIQAARKSWQTPP
jgi:hypothetical protein